MNEEAIPKVLLMLGIKRLLSVLGQHLLAVEAVSLTNLLDLLVHALASLGLGLVADGEG